VSNAFNLNGSFRDGTFCCFVAHYSLDAFVDLSENKSSGVK
jgi:hypothetical protein